LPNESTLFHLHAISVAQLLIVYVVIMETSYRQHEALIINSKASAKFKGSWPSS